MLISSCVGCTLRTVFVVLFSPNQTSSIGYYFGTRSLVHLFLKTKVQHKETNRRVSILPLANNTKPTKKVRRQRIDA